MKTETITTAIMLTIAIVTLIPNQGRFLKSPWPISAAFSVNARPITLDHFYIELASDHLRDISFNVDQRQAEKNQRSF